MSLLLKARCFALILSASIALVCCQNEGQKGEQLAKTYCGSCHAFTPPELLDKSTWEKSIFPEMAFRMGLPSPVISKKNLFDLQAALPTIPPQPMVSEEDFSLIEKYYLSLAPDTLPAPRKAEPQLLDQFSTDKFALTGDVPMVTMVRADAGRLFIGSRDNSLIVLSENFSRKEKHTLSSPPALLFAKGRTLLCLEMGVMDPNDQAAGSLVELALDTRNSTSILDSLRRPVYFEAADLNGDQREDYIICEFGNYRGQLEVFENLGRGNYRRHVIEPTPGARKVVVRDFNGDGKMDILALMTQADERLNLYVNQGNFDFDLVTLLRFPPVYGSSYFEVDDFNGDGFFDILYTNGDNNDISPVLKHYHGVRIFLNDGHQQFRESWFYPMYGASWAMARDFDEDGDLDIAASSFFPDFKKHPEQGFIYFENKGGKFLPFSTLDGASGRWLVMEIADIDNDRDSDIILGALDFAPEGGDFSEWKKHPTSLLVLKNKLR